MLWWGLLEVESMVFFHVHIGSYGFTNHFPPRPVLVVRRRRLLGSTNVQPYSDCFTYSGSRREATRSVFPVGGVSFFFFSKTFAPHERRQGSKTTTA